MLLRKAGEKATHTLNLLPAQEGVSDHFSPYAIMTSRNLNYKRDLQVPFGAYVQADEETQPRNSNKSRTLDCIYFQPAENRQEGHELMHIQTGELITHRTVHKVPITQAVIDAVDRLG